MGLYELTSVSVGIRILLSLFLGGIIGLERGMKNRPAGMRTYMLVSVGSCLIMMTNQFIYQQTLTGDPVRMSAQVVSGIGFLGAGTIIVTRRNQIKGLTTAAGLWASAAVGLAVGIGFYEGALAGGLAVFTVLTLLQNIDNRMRESRKYLDLYIELQIQVPLSDFLRSIRTMEMEFSNIQVETDTTLNDKVRSFTITLRTRRQRNHLALISEIRKIHGVVYLEEL